MWISTILLNDFNYKQILHEKVSTKIIWFTGLSGSETTLSKN